MTEREIARKKEAARRARRERERKARNRRVVLTVCLMLAVCVASIGGTIAWLQDTSGAVVNTFSPSDINISLTEEGVVLDNDGDGAKTVKMVPGDVIDKQVEVEVTAGSEPCWVFVKVAESSTLDTYIDYAIAEGWTQYEGTTDVYYRKAGSIGEDGTVTLVGSDAKWSVIGYNVTTGEGETAVTTFNKDQVLVKTTVTKDKMNELNADNATLPSLTFRAAAVQMAHRTVNEAYNEVAAFLNGTGN